MFVFLMMFRRSTKYSYVFARVVGNFKFFIVECVDCLFDVVCVFKVYFCVFLFIVIDECVCVCYLFRALKRVFYVSLIRVSR